MESTTRDGQFIFVSRSVTGMILHAMGTCAARSPVSAPGWFWGGWEWTVGTPVLAHFISGSPAYEYEVPIFMHNLLLGAGFELA